MSGTRHPRLPARFGRDPGAERPGTLWPHGVASRIAAADVRNAGHRQFSGAERRGPGRPSHERHRHLPRHAAFGQRGSEGRAPDPRVCRRLAALCADLADRPRAKIRRGQQVEPAAFQAGDDDVGQEKGARGHGGARPGQRHDPASGETRCQTGHCLPSRQPLATGIRGGLPLHRDEGPGLGDCRREARHAAHAAHGPAAVRRRRIRKDRSGDAGRLQGGRSGTASRPAGPHDRARRAALSHVLRADGRISLQRAGPLAFLHPGAANADARGDGGGRSRHRRGHAPARAKGHSVQGFGPVDHRRGAAVRRRRERDAQTAAVGSRRAHDECHADPPHAAPVAVGNPRYLEPHHAAARPAGDRDPHLPL